MGKRRKKRLMVYLDPDDPVFAYVDAADDKSGRAVKLMRAGLKLELDGDVAESAAPEVTVTRERVTVTDGKEPATGAERRPVTVTVTNPQTADDNPGWDDDQN